MPSDPFTKEQASIAPERVFSLNTPVPLVPGMKLYVASDRVTACATAKIKAPNKMAWGMVNLLVISTIGIGFMKERTGKEV